MISLRFNALTRIGKILRLIHITTPRVALGFVRNMYPTSLSLSSYVPHSSEIRQRYGRSEIGYND